MKLRYTLYVLTCLLFFSCGEDRRKEYAPRQAADKWIESVLRQDYYWYEEMPTTKQNYFTAPDKFFKSLLSKSDSYSTIDVSGRETTRTLQQTEYSFGFDFELYKIPNNDTAYFVRVLYVASDSPAAEIDLNRGDWIYKMNNEFITAKNGDTLLGGSSMTLDIGAYNEEQDTILTYRKETIGNARMVADPPVYYSNVYDTSNGKTGYLVYNHFSPGETIDDETYNNQLRELSNRFKAEGVTDFILDLRYNQGGEMGAAQLLATILAPQSAIGKKMGYMEYNNQFDPQIEEFFFNEDLLKEGTNLNIQTLYVLTSSVTASASELLIASLAPYTNQIVVIGNKTKGQNVGVGAYTNEEERLIMYPVLCKMYNVNDETYGGGIAPHYSILESSNLALSSLQLGDPDELLLSTALNLIEGVEPPTESRQAAISTSRYNSLTQREQPALVVKSVPFAKEIAEE